MRQVIEGKREYVTVCGDPNVIAAASELLEALKAVYAALNSHTASERIAAGLQAEAALAKAEGRGQ